MPVTLIVNNTPYSYPSDGDEPGWGGEATGWAEGVTEALNDILGPNDILETAFNIANNVTDPATPVTGLIFNTASVRSAEITYSIFRRSDVEPSGNTESGTIRVVYDNVDGWSISQTTLGNAGVNFTIDSTGQINYTSTALNASNYSGTMKFRAKALQQ